MSSLNSVLSSPVLCAIRSIPLHSSSHSIVILHVKQALRHRSVHIMHRLFPIVEYMVRKGGNGLPLDTYNKPCQDMVCAVDGHILFRTVSCYIFSTGRYSTRRKFRVVVFLTLFLLHSYSYSSFLSILPHSCSCS